MARLEAQDHRRFLKAHLPADGLPVFDEVKYVHVARDGRDACLSFHNHGSGLTPEVRAGLEDETVGRPYPRIATDPAEYFHRWLTEDEEPGYGDSSPATSFCRFERTWWDERHRPNVLLVHYNDLTADLPGEMRRVADFLDTSVAPSLWPDLVAAAGFEAMRQDGDRLMGSVAASFQGGASRFFHKGANGRWLGVFRNEDLALYGAMVDAMLSPSCARWTARGRLEAGDPRLVAD